MSAGLETRLRDASADGQLERVAAFNATVFGSQTADFTRALFTHHPHNDRRDVLFLEDAATGAIVASLALLPWTLRYEGVDLPAGEMGIVATAPEHRGRGLSRRLMDAFFERFRARGCLISHIQGIPYVYRRMGYAYAIPLEGGLVLEPRQVARAERQMLDWGDPALEHAAQAAGETGGRREASPAAEGSALGVRRAREGDLAELNRLYRELCGDLALHALRDEATWRYLLGPSLETEMAAETWVVPGDEGGLRGYYRLPVMHFGEEQPISEASRLAAGDAIGVLRAVAARAAELGKPGVRVNVPPGHILMRLARALGAHDRGTYPWQILIPDAAALLEHAAPLLERRLAQSEWAGLTRAVRLNLYRETIALAFDQGRLRAVERQGRTEANAIRIPPPQFAQLFVGWRDREQLAEQYPDVLIAPEERTLIDALFPRRAAFIHMNY